MGSTIHGVTKSQTRLEKLSPPLINGHTVTSTYVPLAKTSLATKPSINETEGIYFFVF